MTFISTSFFIEDVTVLIWLVGMRYDSQCNRCNVSVES